LYGDKNSVYTVGFVDLCGAVVGILLINASVLWEFFNLSDNAVFQF